MALFPVNSDRPLPDSRPSLSVVNPPDPAPRLMDDELMFRQAFTNNAQEGCTLLFRRYYTNLVNHAVRFVYSKEIAEDLVAEVFTTFWQERIFERVTTSYRAYLYQAVRYRAYNYLRWELHPSDSLDSATEQSPSPALQPDQMLHYTELHQKIDAVIQKLPPQCQRAFLLSRIEGKKYAEIAQDLKISNSAVEKLLIRALNKLRQELKTEWLIPLVLWGAWLFHALFA